MATSPSSQPEVRIRWFERALNQVVFVGKGLEDCRVFEVGSELLIVLVSECSDVNVMVELNVHCLRCQVEASRMALFSRSAPGKRCRSRVGCRTGGHR